MRPLLLALMLCVAPASAEAQLRDVRAARSGSHASVIIDFASPPTHAAAAPTAAGFALDIGGAHLSSGLWETAVADILVTLDVRSGPSGSVIAARTVDEVLAARALVVGSTAVIELELGALGAPIAAVPAPPATMPAPTPARHAVKAPAPVVPDPAPVPVSTPAPPPPEDAPVPVAVSEAAQALATRYAGDTSETTCADADAQVRDDPWNFEMVRQHGACLANEGWVEEAEEVFNRLLTFAPDDIEAHLGLGLTMAAAGDDTAARLHLEDALNLATTDAQAVRARQLLEQLEASEPVGE